MRSSKVYINSKYIENKNTIEAKHAIKLFQDMKEEEVKYFDEK